MFSLVDNLPKLQHEDLNKLVVLTEVILKKYDQFTNCSYVVQEIFIRCITCLWLQLDDLEYNSVKHLYILILKSITELDQLNTIGQSKYLESAILFLFSICIKAQTDFSMVVYNIMKNKIYCKTIFEILNLILSKNPVDFCDNLEKYKSGKYWDQKILMDQLTTNTNIIELFCQQCTTIDSLIDMKYLVLSNFTPALHIYFTMYVSIDCFISKLSNLRRDTEIAYALLCINNHLCNLVSFKTTLTSI